MWVLPFSVFRFFRNQFVHLAEKREKRNSLFSLERWLDGEIYRRRRNNRAPRPSNPSVAVAGSAGQDDGIMGHGEGGGDGMISVSRHILCVGRQGQVFPSGIGSGHDGGSHRVAKPK